MIVKNKGRSPCSVKLCRLKERDLKIKMNNVFFFFFLFFFVFFFVLFFVFYSFISVKSFVQPEKVVTLCHVTESLFSDWSPELVVMRQTACPVIP